MALFPSNCATARACFSISDLSQLDRQVLRRLWFGILLSLMKARRRLARRTDRSKLPRERPTRSFRDGDVVRGKRVADRAVEFGNGFVEICACLQFTSSGNSEIGLTLDDKEEGRCSRAKLSFLTRVKFFRRDTRVVRRCKSRF